jgi:hypothetical protein
MLRALLIAVPLLFTLPFDSAPAVRGDVRAQFLELAEKSDAIALAKLWRDNPYEILTAIDADLEGALATWERSPDKPDTAAIKKQQERAVWGARIASEATGHPIFVDYATSYAGFTTEQKKSFRGGQKAHGRARKAQEAKDFAGAAKAGRECADLALPLGDWWGYAMGLSAEGQALAASGDNENALASLSQARVVYHDLGLVGDEYSCTSAMAKVLLALKHYERALVTVRSAIALREIVGDEKAQMDLLMVRGEIETASGDLAAAAVTRKELEKLSKH